MTGTKAGVSKLKQHNKNNGARPWSIGQQRINPATRGPATPGSTVATLEVLLRVWREMEKSTMVACS